VVPRLSIDSLRAEVSFTRTTVGTRRLAIHGLLLFLTFLSTTIVGVVLSQSFQAGRPVALDQYIFIFSTIWTRPILFLDGLAFSLTLITVLLS